MIMNYRELYLFFCALCQSAGILRVANTYSELIYFFCGNIERNKLHSSPLPYQIVIKCTRVGFFCSQTSDYMLLVMINQKQKWLPASYVFLRSPRPKFLRL